MAILTINSQFLHSVALNGKSFEIIINGKHLNDVLFSVEYISTIRIKTQKRRQLETTCKSRNDKQITNVSSYNVIPWILNCVPINRKMALFMAMFSRYSQKSKQRTVFYIVIHMRRLRSHFTHLLFCSMQINTMI